MDKWFARNRGLFARNSRRRPCANLEPWMRHALALAARGRGFVEPNPMVGAVVLDSAGKLVGEGWHQKFGGPHAEIHALEAAGEKARGGTLVVTLEPCCHHGKTPPCTDAILKAGIRRVVAAMTDPFPKVAGGGLKLLRDAGLEVHIGLCEPEAKRLNEPYLKLLRTGRPWVHAKWAMTLDGKIATRTGDSKWISGEESRRRVHELRGKVDAIIVGRGTVIADDPLLTARPARPARADASGRLGVRRSTREVSASCDGPRSAGDRLHGQGERGEAERVGRGRRGSGGAGRSSPPPWRGRSAASSPPGGGGAPQGSREALPSTRPAPRQPPPPGGR